MAGKIIAMWSGPRNLSTAMMRAFGNRADCMAVDEPFYGAYLAATGLNHPMREAVLANTQTNADLVAQNCTGPFDAPWCYQKHMPHHMVEGFPLSWAAKAINVFLIRHPRRVLASYARKHTTITEADIGMKRMNEIYAHIAHLQNKDPIVVSADDISRNPGAALTALCTHIGMPFDDAMLSWQPGPRPEDGVWGPHWYDAIWASTGLMPRDPGPLPDLPAHLKAIESDALPFYEPLAARALKVL